MAAEIIDIFIEQGADFSLDITLTDDLGVPYDLTVHTLSGRIQIDSTIFELTFVEDVDGLVYVNIPALTTDTIPHGVGKYTITLTNDVTSAADRILSGRAYIDKRIK